MRRTIGFLLLVLACDGSPTNPRTNTIADGRWTGDNACLSVRPAPAASDLIVGCGHGVFTKPDIRGDGTFDVDGTFRIEAGPISIDPAPPAHFSGSLINATLTLTVRPSSGSATTYRLTMDPNGGSCSPLCV